MPQYAGLCYMAVSRCEASLNSPHSETWALVKAGRQFYKAHSTAEDTGLVSPGGEFLEAAVSCLGQAGVLCSATEPERILGGGLALETGLKLGDHPHQAAASFLNAAMLLADHPALQLHALDELTDTRIRMGDLDGALSVLSQTVLLVENISNPPFGIYSDILLRCEISRVLLLLLLRPPPQLLAPHLTAVLERYVWLGDSTDCPVPWMSEELFMLLQSLVMSCQSKDVESLLAIEADLCCHLNGLQQQLLGCLVQSLADTSDN